MQVGCTQYSHVSISAMSVPQSQHSGLSADFMEMLTAQDLQGDFIGQMHGGKKCPLNGITNNDKVWIKGAMLGTWFMF